jgi:hypothetical protein
MRETNKMAKLLHCFSAIFFFLALGGVVALLIFDLMNQLELTSMHRQAGAWSFILIGASYLSVLLSSRRPLKEIAKQMALGLAFLLWGCEQFVPAGPLATAMDTAVVLIFVVDLSLIIVGNLRSAHHEKS